MRIAPKNAIAETVMMQVLVASYVAALFFALNIGASGAAATMGVAYGSGALQNRLVALLLSGMGVFLGAVLGGGEVVKTLGSGLVPGSLMSTTVAVIILGAAGSSLFAANLFGIPLSTSEVTVGAVVGVGIAYQSLYFGPLWKIVSFWVLVPAAAFSVAWMAVRILGLFPAIEKWKGGRWMVFLLIITGFLEAVAAGMNNVANAVGPLVGAGVMSVTEGVWLGGFFVAVGAVILGSNVLETNGKRITCFSMLEGSVLSGTGALLVGVASLMGIPVPLTQVTTAAIIGLGAAKEGFSLLQKEIVINMVKVWVISPVFSAMIAYGIVKAFLMSDVYGAVLPVASMLVIMGAFLPLLRRFSRKNGQSVAKKESV